jgi:hypothetical protein
MSDAKPRSSPRPANDNHKKSGLQMEVDFEAPTKILKVEIEVFAELLDAMPPAANDNEGESP